MSSITMALYQANMNLALLKLDDLYFEAEEFASTFAKAAAEDPNFKNHIETLITCYLKWGTISEAMVKSRGSKKRTLRALQKKYDIKDNGLGNATLEYVSSAYPWETCRILQEQAIEKPKTKHFLKLVGVEIPHCMRTRSFFSLIPCTESDKELRIKLVKACLVYQYLVHPGSKFTTPGNIITSILSKVCLNYELRSFNPAQRLEYLKQLDIKEADTNSGVSYYSRMLRAPISDTMLNLYFPTLTF